MNPAGVDESPFGDGNRVSDSSRWVADEENATRPVAHLEIMFGWRLWITITCLFFGLLLSALETSIIATALVSISSSLGGSDKSNWVVTAYLITYTASSSVLFKAWAELLAMAVMTEITPIKFMGVVVGLMTSIFALSSLIGPVLGGVITSHTTWRWVFFLNIPPGAAICLVVLAPFPANAEPLSTTWRTVQGVDFLGITTSLAGCVLLIFALESGGLFYPWNSAPIVAAFVVAGLCLIAFATWQRRHPASLSSGKRLHKD